MNKIIKLKEVVASRNNNFDLLRLFAAILVLFSHCYPLTGSAIEPLVKFTHGFDTFGGMAVACFFVISGFLITRSYLQHNSLFGYFSARILRIFPALLIAVLFAAFIIGPLVTTLPLREYFKSHELFTYVIDNSYLHMNYVLPSVFVNNPYANAVNGSLWTLPLEFGMYILVAIAGIVGLLKRRNFALIALMLVLVGYFVALSFVHMLPAVLQHVIEPAHLDPILCFAFGAIAYIWRDKIILHPRGIVVGITGLALINVLNINPVAFRALFYLTFAYSILWFAYQSVASRPSPVSWSKGSWLTRYGDFSYGIYIFAFPVQQTVMHYLHFTSPWLLFVTALPVTYGLAVCSWYLIEKPAQRLSLSLRVTQPGWSLH